MKRFVYQIVLVRLAAKVRTVSELSDWDDKSVASQNCKQNKDHMKVQRKQF